MFGSVEEYFKKWFPDLVGRLDRGGDFWPPLKANTINNEELGQKIFYLASQGSLDSAIFLASTVVLAARMIGILKNPG